MFDRYQVCIVPPHSIALKQPILQTKSTAPHAAMPEEVTHATVADLRDCGHAKEALPNSGTIGAELIASISADCMSSLNAAAAITTAAATCCR